jgi:hypothetical protein
MPPSLSPLPANDRLGVARDAPLSVGRALVLLSDREQCSAWEKLTPARTGLEVVLEIGLPSFWPSDDAFDAIAVDVSAANGTALEWSLSLLRRRPAAELVLFCDDADAPEVLALRSLGCAGLVVGPTARDWILAALPALVRVGEARRRLQRWQSELPALPAANGPQPMSATPIPLAVAEGRFRESYIRGVLARAGNRGDAARLAGVPYRTFCKILQKLELTGARLGERGRG